LRTDAPGAAGNEHDLVSQSRILDTGLHEQARYRNATAA
jgi:hypothetical protein